MGYNYFNVKNVSKTINSKLNNFLASLGEMLEKGKIISFADRDISYMLSLQHDRIKSKGLELDYNIYPRGKNTNRFTELSNWNDAHYESTVCIDYCGIKREVRKNGIIIYKDDKKSVVYGTVTDVLNGVHPDDDSFCCPNCGSISTVASLQNGCAYCGTKYQMDDLFPKISSFYFLEDSNLAKGEFKPIYIKVYFVSLIILYILECLVYGDFFLPGNLIKNTTLLISAIVALLLGNFLAAYMGTIFYVFIKGLVKSIVSLNKIGTAGSRGRFEARMKRISPEFSYEYFTSKAISLIKTVIFSKDEKELMFYEGDKLDPKMKNIIDMNYAGALGCKSFVDEGNFVTVTTKAYFDVLYANEGKVYNKSQVFCATFKRRTDIPVDFNFSMAKIACPSCGASFDATKIKICPYCGNKYDIISDDWILIELEYN